jgi:uncharacterized repeat protein (TIGR03803 family)
MTPQSRTRLATSLTVILIILSFTSPASAEWKEKVLHSFQGGKDGSLPAGGVVFDSAGNLYGVTTDGGLSCPAPGCGTVFQLAPPARNGDPWTETVLHVFNGNDGSRPAGSVILDANGNLYGTTAYGGSGTCILLGGNVGCGLVYELSPPAEKDGRWKYSILYSFQGGKDGQYPVQNLTLDTAGNLYGATLYGGGFGTCDAPYYLYCGTIFKLSPPKKNGDGWNESVLHSFKSGTDGANPDGSLALDSKGAIYGTTYAGGTQNCTYQGYVGCGTAFRLSPPNKKGSAWTEKQLHVFAAKSDGANPAGDLIFDAQGSLYGTAAGGSNSGDGVVFRLTAVGHGRWKDTVLREFTRNDKYGADPVAGLTFDPIGDLYGTTYSGNTYSGSVFQLKPPAQKGATWTAGILHGFTGSPDGAQPAANLIFDREGNLYSTTQKGGTGKCSFYGCGTVYEVSR